MVGRPVLTVAAPGRADLRLLDDPADLAALVELLRLAPRYALDTEFHRERTYWPHVALVQVAWPTFDERPAGCALIDPLAVDLSPLADVLAGPATMVAHAAEQDLEVLVRVCGRGPRHLFDTQIAAGFLGLGSASLSTLSAAMIGVEVAKGDRLTDWSRRPLSASQLAYAAADVDHLLELADAIAGALERRGRSEWAEEECEALRTRALTTGDPARAWWRLRDARQLRGASRGVAQEVAAWRELRAQELDQPLRSVLPDLALQSIAHRPPTSPSGLEHIRGLEGRHLRASVGAELFAAIERGRNLDPALLQTPPSDDVSRELRPGVALALAWIAQLARDEDVDTAALATRSDVAAYLRGDPSARLARGWRAEMVGRPLRELLAGRASLAFEPGGSLVLEVRSGRPLGDAPEPGGPAPP
jgi:ribonuclease D